jgi:hypothetical protein
MMNPPMKMAKRKKLAIFERTIAVKVFTATF